MQEPTIEELLNETEGSSLDFKRDQYPFGSDDEKCELLKDILAFANPWRRETASILVGVEEIKGGRSRPIGAQRHFEDASLQQFVNSKTQRPITFSYRVESCEGVEIGVIGIPVQERPFFLRADFGRLKKDVVYIRQGSSTAMANPDEIAKMALAAGLTPSPALSVRATVVNAYKGEFTIAISNDGAGVARAPYLEVAPPGPFQVSQYGLDGTLTGRHGLPVRPQGPGSSQVKFAGTTDVVVHPGSTLEVTRVEWHGQQGKVPSGVDVPYVVGAEGFGLAAGAVHVTFRS